MNRQAQGPWLDHTIAGRYYFDCPNRVALVVRSAGEVEATDAVIRETAQVIRAVPAIIAAARKVASLPGNEDLKTELQWAGLL